MANKITNTDNYTAIADAIRTQLGVSTTYTPSEMPAAILSISGGGGTDEAAEFIVAVWANSSDLSNYTAMPDSIIALNPTTLGNYTFRNKSNLYLQSLPSTLTYIGEYLFWCCNHLALTELPSGVTSIGDYAFYQCTDMQLSNGLPSALITVGERSFYGCTSLNFDELPSGLSNIGSYAFNGCTGLTLRAIPSGVSVINSYAFQDCTGLTCYKEETIGEDTYIYYDAFDTYGTIGAYAFDGCTGIEHVKIRGPKLGTGNTASRCFRNCTGLKTAWISSDVTNVYGSSVSYAPFSGCTNLTDIYTDATSKPSGWSTYFNYIASGTTVNVHYGVSEDDYNEIVWASAP